jgi:peptidoglycan/LPS O-acetylase OafA/YrhL
MSEFRFRHYPELDGFRGLAVVLVIVGHVLSFAVGVHSLLSSLGVLLFFVLSGFLITGVLLNEKAAHGRISLANFYLRRVLRLAPALLIFLAVVTALIYFGALVDVPWYEVLFGLLYMANIVGHSWPLGHLWSLSLEEQFYAMWPWLVARIPTRRLLFVAGAITSLVALARMLAIWNGWFPNMVNRRPWFRIDSIMIGCWLCVATTDDIWRARVTRIATVISPAIGWTALMFWTVVVGKFSPAGRFFPMVYLSVQTVLCTIVLGQLILSPTPTLSLIFSNPILRHLGRISYGLYLWQQLFIDNPNAHWWMLQRFPISVIVALAIAELSYWLVEVRFLNWKERFSAGSPSSDKVQITDEQF